MRKKHNPKIVIAIGVCLFVGISVVVINAHDMQTISRVKVSNQSIVINQSNTGIANADIGMNSSGNLGNQNVGISDTGGSFNNSGSGAGNQNVNINNNGNFGNSGAGINNSGGFSNQGGFSNASGRFNNNGAGVNNNGSNIINNTGAGFGGQNSSFGNSNQGMNNQNYQTSPNRFKYQDIDWSVWKSNFVNRILDDSMYLTGLDNYGVGTWFYYSFNVTDTGEIKDVTVFSFYLSEEDKKSVRDLIRSYAHKPITIFPKDSRRKKAKVKAIMLLGNTETKSNASNFNDIEKIKIKY